MIETRLEHPAAAIESLVSELKIGEPQPELWEGLHAASARDGVEADLAAAYTKVATGHRLQQLSPAGQADLVMHAADFFQGVIGDGAKAESLLERALEIVPGHPEAFSRLKRRFENARDNKRLAELYAKVAAAPPRPARELVHEAVNLVAALPAKTPISDEACRQFLPLVPASVSMIDALEAHCRKTGRAALACELIEHALAQNQLAKTSAYDLRRRLIGIYIDETPTSEKAMPHVELMFEQDIADPHARAAAERLLKNRMVASRAAALLQQARRVAVRKAE